MPRWGGELAGKVESRRTSCRRKSFTRSVLSILSQLSNDVADSNIFALFCAPIEQLNHAVRDFFSERDAIRDADKIRIFEFYTARSSRSSSNTSRPARCSS